MGFNASWLAVHGRSAQSVLAVLHLNRTGEFEELPEAPITGASLPGDWYLVFANDCEFVDRIPLPALSASARAVVCSVEEHVMMSFAAEWINSQMRWSILHDAQQSINHLETTGQLPEQFEDVYAGLKQAQVVAGGDDAGVDYIFDVPVELTKSMTGFRHDQFIEIDAGFERLK